MFEILFLGTSASAPSVKRGLPAQMVRHNEHRFLIDCGEGTQRQILKSGIGFKNLNKIFITHSHLDHILGLAGLLSTLSRWEATEEIEVFAHKKAMDRIHDLIYGVVLRGAKPPIPIRLREIKPGVVFKTRDLTLSAFPVKHRGPDSLGFLFEEESKRPFLANKAEKLNIPPGPWRSDLVKGEMVTLPDGRVIDPESVLGEIRQGARLVHIGDVGNTKELIEKCQQADALVIEATYLESESELARRFMHITAKNAAELALKAEVKQLILTHISRRYPEKEIYQEAANIFPNVHIARDFDTIKVKHS
ncbi:MAG: ribonuclease Z [Anaerolineaceae bacterium]|nr:ribonuclease Z [Anaerolineaceae bacterium]